MGKTKLIVDSGCNLDLKLAKKYNIDVLPFMINVGDKSYVDLYEISSQEFFDILDSTEERVTTSQPSPQDFVNILEKNCENGYDKFVVITITKKFSGMYQLVKITSEEFMKDHDVKIEVIDSETATTACTDFAIESAEMINDGKDFGYIVDKTKENLKKCQIVALVRSLDALAKGGRLPKAIAKLGNIVGLSPMLTIRDGEIKVEKKIVGKKKSYKEFVNYIREEASKRVNYKLVIAGGNSGEEIKNLEEDLDDVIRKAKEYKQIDMTPVIGVHVGSGALVCTVYEVD